MRETKTVYRPLEPVIEGAEIVEVIINGELRKRQKIRLQRTCQQYEGVHTDDVICTQWEQFVLDDQGSDDVDCSDVEGEPV